MKPMAAAALGALISGVAFYAVGTRAAQTNGWVEMPAIVQTVDGRYVQVPDARTMGFVQPAAYLAGNAQLATPQPAAARATRTVYRTAPVEERVIEQRVEQRTAPRRSLAKTALIIGGSTASGAGVGGWLGGRKGALVGAAIGGGAASIYEATRR